MKRFVRWPASLAMALLCAAAWIGWPQSSAEREMAAQEIPEAELMELSRLADGILAGENRIWVVSAHTEDGLIRFRGSDPSEAIQWIKRQHDADVWYLNVQGKLDANRTLDQLWERMQSAAEAELIHAYEDGNTFSNSYVSPRFSAAVGSGDEAMNVQAAAHLNTETGVWRITLGTPAILIEY